MTITVHCSTAEIVAREMEIFTNAQFFRPFFLPEHVFQPPS